MKRKITIDEELMLDRYVFGVSYERIVNGRRERLDPTTIRCVTVKPEQKIVVDFDTNKPVIIFQSDSTSK